MDKTQSVILAGKGFPWLPALVWVLVLAAGMAVGFYVIGSTTVGGTFLIAAAIANAAFAASLGH